MFSHPLTTGAIVPTLGALVLVQLIRQGGMSSPAMVIGYWLSEWLGVFFILLSAALGALGSFFSVRGLWAGLWVGCGWVVVIFWGVVGTMLTHTCTAILHKTCQSYTC